MKNWKNCLLLDNSSIWEAVRLIQSNALQTALIVDKENRLSGIITDGDIRRGLLEGMDFSGNVSLLMNKEPVVASKDMEINEIKDIMREKVLHQIPVVDGDGRVVDFYFFTDILKRNTVETPVVLMVGGLGTRLKYLTKDCPKPLLNVGNKPILETILENFIEQGFVNFYFSVNYKSDMIEEYFGDGERYGIKINYLHEDKALGTAGSLCLLPEICSYPVIIMNGDILTKVDFNNLIKYHQKKGSVATMTVRKYMDKIPYGVIISENGQIREIQEKPELEYKVNAGIYVLEKYAVDLIPKNQFFNMTQLFDELIAKRVGIYEYAISDYWIDIGRIEDFNKANSDFERFFI